MTRLRYNNEDTFTTGGKNFMMHLALRVVHSPDGQLESLRIFRIVAGTLE